MSGLLRFFTFCLFFTFFPLHAQERDGNVVVEKQGFALVKPQAWSSPANAELVKFTAFTDRTAQGSSGAGYFVLRLPSGTNKQVANTCLVKLVFKPATPQNLLDDSQRQTLQKTIEDLVSTSTTLPTSRPILTEYLKPLQAAAARYDSGEVMEDGVWFAREIHKAALKKKIESQLRTAMVGAKVKKEFDLKVNRDFARLSEFAEEDALLKQRLAEMLVEHAKSVSLEAQAEIQVRLQSPLSPADADSLIAQLKELPDPSLRTASVLKQSAIAANLAKDIEVLKQDIESLWSRDDLAQDKLPALSKELTNRIDTLARKLKVFHAGLPPVGIWVPEAVSKASVTLKDGITVLQTRLEAREYRTMIETVDALAPTVSLIGPKTRDGFYLIKLYPNAEISKFSKLVEEGKTFLAAGDKKKAAAKFKEALAVMPDPGVESRLSEIK
jgi:hypothetical protein